MKISRLIPAITVVLLWAGLAEADVLRLTNGKRIEGTFLGGTSREIQFIGPDGVSSTYRVADVAGVDFASTASSSSSASASSSSATSNSWSTSGQRRGQPLAAGTTIPAGQRITVRMIDSIDTKDTVTGERFRASIDDPVFVNGEEVIPRGADCHVQVVRAEQGGRVAGRAELAIKLFDVVAGGRTYEIASSNAELQSGSEGKSTAAKTIGGAAIGAAIGAIAGGGKGAAIGAGAGAGGGLVLATLKGPELKVPSETRLSFELSEPLTLR